MLIPASRTSPAFQFDRIDRGHFTLKNNDDAIMPLITSQPDPGHAHEERHICIDTTASGGNAALLGEIS